MLWSATCLIVAVFSDRQHPLVIRPPFTLTADTHPFIAATAVSRIVSRANNMADNDQGSDDSNAEDVDEPGYGARMWW